MANHKELCFGLRHMGSPRAERAADLIESQAARIQQQALEYASLQAQCDEHLARIAELEADRDSWRDQASQRVADWDEMRKERDALKEDAERYRWLRDFGKDGVNLKPPCEHVHTLLYSHPVGVIPASRVITGDELDRAIDAALQAEKETRS